MAVGRDAFDEQHHHHKPGERGDAGDILRDVGLVDHLAQELDRARAGTGRDAHQHQRRQIAPPVDQALFHHQATDQDRRAIGIVGDFLGRFGHAHSIDRAGPLAPARLVMVSLPAKSGLFKPN